MSRFKWLAFAAILAVSAFIIAASPPTDEGSTAITQSTGNALTNTGQITTTTSPPEVGDIPTGVVTSAAATTGNTGQVNTGPQIGP
ncbi:MAG: hypothetical protein HYY51_02665 [Candidatus Magasanikbacteria bacterium]|nr:hypothetical protein [Candidatus Magasanikbacteria bacterium]